MADAGCAPSTIGPRRAADAGRPSLRLALACGIAPLVAAGCLLGTFVFVRRWELMMAGGVLILVAIPVWWLGLSQVRVWRGQGVGLRAVSPEWLRRRRIAALILWLNPLAALACIGVHLYTRVSVTVVNRSAVTLDSVRVVCALVPGARPQMDVDLGPLPPGARASTGFNPRGDGTVMLHLRAGARTADATAYGYVTHLQGGESTVEVGDDLRVLVRSTSTDSMRPDLAPRVHAPR